MKLVFFSFFFFACSHLPHEKEKITSSGIDLISEDTQKLSTLMMDLIYLRELDQTQKFTKNWWVESLKVSKNSPFTSFLQQNASTIEHDEYACSPGEVACTHPQSPGVIFVTNDFFRLSIYARLATLIHEAFHWFRPTKHISCRHKLLKGHTCDNNLLSPYGIEVVFLTQILNFGVPWFTEDYYVLLQELQAASMRIQ